MRVPIRRQFLAPLAAVALASLTLVAAGNWWIATARTTERVEERLRGVLAALAQSGYPLTGGVLRRMAGLAGAEFVLADGRGEPVASSGLAPAAPLATGDTAAGTIDGLSLGEDVRVGGTRYLHASLRVSPAGAAASPRLLHVFFPRSDYNLAWRMAFVPPLGVGAATIAAMALVTQIVAGRVTRTLDGVGRDVRRLARGDFAPVTRPDLDDEIRDLAAAVSQTAERLAEYESELRRTERLRAVATLGAGLAHELRNAVTGCRLALDLHAEGCTADPSDDSLAVARRQLRLIEGRLQQILHVGRGGEPSAGPTDPPPIRLVNAVAEAIDLVRPAARHAGVEIDWDGGAFDGHVCADGELFGQAVVNLLLNAIEAATKRRAEGGSEPAVRVRLHEVGDEAELVVADTGDGPTASVAAGLFEPFVTSKPEGVGLGLAVARRVVETHGGRVGWTRDEGMTLFRVRLPRSPEGPAHG